MRGGRCEADEDVEAGRDDVDEEADKKAKFKTNLTD